MTSAELTHSRNRGNLRAHGGSAIYVPRATLLMASWQVRGFAGLVRAQREAGRPVTQQKSITTTDAGAPVESQELSLTVGPDGPVLLQDHYLLEQMANFDREQIPGAAAAR